MNKKTLVIGASLDHARYSNFVIKKLVSSGYEVVAIGKRKGEVSGVWIDTEYLPFNNLHTVTLYVNPKNQKALYNYIIELNPKRVIFNPGTENTEFYDILRANNIPFEEACTLVLLSTNQY